MRLFRDWSDLRRSYTLLSLIVVFQVVEFYRFLNVRKSIFFLLFSGKDGENRTSDLTVHNLTSCRRRYCEEVGGRLKIMLKQQMLLELFPSKLVFPPHCPAVDAIVRK